MMKLFLLYTVVIGCLFNLALTARPFPQCNVPVTQYCNRPNCNVFYVDPNAAAGGDGSKSTPWNSFATALNNVKSRKIDNYNGVFPPTDFVVKNPSGTVVGGDVIVLLSGAHPWISILNFYNDLPITVTGDVGAVPIVNGVTLTSTSNWIIKCLNITTSNPNPNALIVNIGKNSPGPSYDNIIEKNTIYSYPDLEFYRGKDQAYLFNASATAINSRDTSSLIVRDNYIYNNKRGISIAGPNTIVSGNFIDYIIGDGLRILHNNTLVEFNTVQNSMNVDDGADHRDGLQLFTISNLYNLANITIRNNRFFGDQDKNRPFAAGFQGISSYDSQLYNVRVENNLVTTIDFWNGIALYKAHDCTIMSNTVIDATAGKPLWITTVNGVSGNLVQNNIAHALSYLDGSTAVSNAIKQWTVTELRSYFVDPDNFNFHLKANASSPFIGKGNSTGAPLIDNDGNIRTGAYDIGCFAFTSVPNTPDNAPPSSGPSVSSPASPTQSPDSNAPTHLSGADVVRVSTLLLVALSTLVVFASV